MKNNRLRFGLTVIIISYGGLLAYFCTAKPFEPNDTVIEQKEDAIVENTPVSFEENPTGSKAGAANTVGPVYLSEITAFYERIITLLFGVIGFLLVFSFLYVHLTSKIQAEDMASDALKTESFQIRLKNMSAKEAREYGSELIDVYAKIPELEERIEFLEEQANIQGYELSEERADEASEKGSDELIEEGTDEVRDGNN